MPNPTCRNCGETAEVPNARFCEGCGQPLAGAAAAAPRGCRCLAPVPGPDGFCEECGMRVAAPEPAVPVPDYEFAVDPRLAMACDKGRRHPTNEDHGAVARRRDGDVLLVVCDGVSTAVDAEGASRAAVDAAVAAFMADAGADPEPRARACLAAAAAAVAAMNAPDDPDGGSATTAVLAVVRGRTATLAWVGDSRGYLVTPAVREELLTRDDSWCRQVVDAGKMSYETALKHPNAHAITQWLGLPAGELDVHVRTVAIPPRSALLLCSDGLWNYVDGDGLLGRAYTEAAAGGDAPTACRRLVALANAAGGRDNITVAIHEPA